MGKRELIALLLISCGSQCSVALPRGLWVGLRCVVVIFPAHKKQVTLIRKYHNHKLQTNPRHTHLLFVSFTFLI